jgi:hypothetical protein
MNWSLRYLLPAIGLGAGVAAFLGLMTLEVVYALPGHVVPPDGQDLSDWLDGFRAAEFTWVLYPAIGCALVWDLLSVALPSYRGDQRVLWLLLWIVSAAAAILCISFGTPREQNGVGIWAPVFTIINGVVIFWLATAPFSTVTHKFAPFGSMAVRRIW